MHLFTSLFEAHQYLSSEEEPGEITDRNVFWGRGFIFGFFLLVCF
jgi:hypothetical protein